MPEGFKIQTAEEVKTIEDFDDWYIVQVQSNMEAKVRETLLELNNPRIKEVIVPVEKIKEIKNGDTKIKNKKLFPGYVFIQMQPDMETFNIIKQNRRVQGFLQKLPDNTPVKMTLKAAKDYFERISIMAGDAPKANNKFKEGDVVRVVDGAFKDFEGSIQKVNVVRNQYSVRVKVFGRDVDVDIGFASVEHI